MKADRSVKEQKPNSSRSNRSSEKLLAVIEYLSMQARPVRLQDIANELEIPPSTALRFLTVLKERNYVEQEADTSRYYLTLKFFELANNYVSHRELNVISRPYLTQIAKSFNCIAYLVTDQNRAAYFIEKAFPEGSGTAKRRIGFIAPQHCTAAGKILLLNYSEAELDKYIADKGLPRYTKYTITTKRELLKELENIRLNGYSVANMEFELENRFIAAPVYCANGKIAAAISSGGAYERLTDVMLSYMLPALLNCACSISVHLGYQLPPESIFHAAPFFHKLPADDDKI